MSDGQGKIEGWSWLHLQVCGRAQLDLVARVVAHRVEIDAATGGEPLPRALQPLDVAHRVRELAQREWRHRIGLESVIHLGQGQGQDSGLGFG